MPQTETSCEECVQLPDCAGGGERRRTATESSATTIVGEVEGTKAIEETGAEIADSCRGCSARAVLPD